MFVGFGALVLSNVLFNFFASRVLGPIQYGVFNSFFYLLLAFCQPNNSLQLAVAKRSSEGKFSLKNVVLTFSLIAFFIFLLLLFILPFILRFYNIFDYSYSLFGALIVFLWVLTAGMRGVFQGEMKFFTYGLNIGLEGFLRFFAVLLLFYIGLRVKGAVFSSIVAGFFSLLFLLRPLKNDAPFQIDFPLIKEFISAFSIFFPFGLIFQIDLTLAQFFLSEIDIGYLSACGLFGKNLVFLSIVLANVVFSYVINKSDRYFLFGNLLTFGVFFFAFLFTVFFGKWLILFIQGEKFLEASKIFPQYIIFSFLIAIIQQIVNFSIAKGIKIISIILWFFLIFIFATGFLLLKSYAAIASFLYFLIIIFIFFDIFLLLIILLYNKKIILTER